MRIRGVLVGVVVRPWTLRLELGHRTNNPASCRVATAAGFVVDTHARLATDPVPDDVRLRPRLRTDPAA